MAPVDVVISGIGGRFPHAHSIEELGERLLEGQCLLEPCNRWTAGAGDTPKNLGLTHEFQKFDNTFFGMHTVLAQCTDPTARIAVEIAFEAIIDAGINPTSMRGSNTHVYTGITQFEGDIAFDALVNGTGYAIMGKNRCMAANRISYFLSLNGRSCSYDSFGGWVGEGLHLAREAIQSGECDTVLVLGLTLASFFSIHKTKNMFGLLSPDSELNPYSDKVDGFARGDAQVAFFVQRADKAKRSYGSIVAAGSETQGSLPNWFLSLEENHFRQFVSSQYKKNKVDPSDVKILEADGLCNKSMVETELNVLDEIFNNGRSANNPLLLGSVKTIVGEAEGAGGLVALTKLILALETGVISPTINRGSFNPNIQGLTDGRYKVVTEPTKLEVTPDTIVAVSSLSYNGIVGHAALKANGKTKKTYDIKDYPLPYLVLISGRNEGIVEKSLKKVTSSPFDPEYLRLTQEVFSETIDRFDWKGFGFHGPETSGKLVVQRENRRPVWFVYSGMGSQWSRCGKDLLKFPVIRETLQRLHNILAPKNVDLMNIVTEADSSIFDNVLNSFVCITAIQICLTNLMNQLGIEPDGIIGHSVGELGCSYADGCLTEEETILASYARGVASLEAVLEPGLMAAVGIGGDEAQKILPPEVSVACRNSSESCTISGPKHDVEKVVKDLTERKIFVRQVNVSNIAYHSPYIRPAAPYLLAHLRKVIRTPKLRSSKWICTSAPKEKWDSDEVRYCSAEYHTNNLLSQVYFEEGARNIPDNALIIELAPHGLLQAIIKRSLGGEVAHVPLTQRGSASPSNFLLTAIGKMFLEGQSPKISQLYPEVSMPVSRNTPSLIPLIEWDHEDDFPLMQRFVPLEEENCGVNLFSPAMEVLGTKYLVPAHILVYTWKQFANLMRMGDKNCSVVFEDVEFCDLCKLEDKALEMSSCIMMGCKGFETYVNDSLVAKGKIRMFNAIDDEPLKHPDLQGSAKLCLSSDDVYAEMSSRGIGVTEKMRSIHELQMYSQDWLADIDFEEGNWTQLLNSLLIMFELRNCERNQNTSSVSHIRQLVIDPTKEIVTRGSARLHLPSSTLLFNGIEIRRVSFKYIERTIPRMDIASLQFIPYRETFLQNQESFFIYIILLCLEKSLVPRPVFNILDFENKHSSLAQKLQAILSSRFSVNSKVTNDRRDISLVLCEPSSIPSVSNVVTAENVLVLCELDGTQRNAFEKSSEDCGLQVITEYQEGGTSKRLVASASTLRPRELSNCEVIKMNPEDEIPRTAAYSSEKLVILVWENGSKKSPAKIFNEMSDMPGAANLRLVFVMTPNAPPFSLDLQLYSEQLRLNLPVNVYFNGKWGNYRSIPLPKRTDFDTIGDIVEPTMTTDRTDDAKIRYIGLNREQGLSVEGIVEPGKRIWDYSADSARNERIMGLGTFDKASGKYIRDHSLVWTVPDSWSLEEAATVPYAYSMAFYALLEVARLRPNEKIFITCPLTPVGQAALHLAFSLNCDIYVLLGSEQEKGQLLKAFPKLTCDKIIISRTEAFGLHLKLAVPEGFNVVLSHLSGPRLRVCTECNHINGRMVQINSEPMIAGEKIGLRVFVGAMGLNGVNESSVLNASVDVKNRVKQWVQNGLNSGVVKPNSARKVYPKKIQDALKLKESDEVGKTVVCLLADHNGFKSKTNFSPSNSPCVIIGGSKTQWLKLAYCLARKGSKNIVVASERTSPCIFARHAQILQREFGASLKNLTIVGNGAELVKEITKLGAVEAIFVFEHSKISEDVVKEISSRNSKDVQLVFLSKKSTYFTRMSERWVKEGIKVKAAVGVDDAPNDKVTPLLDWLLSPFSTTVNDLSGQCYVVRKPCLSSFREAKALPESSAELDQLGASIRGKTAPVFREITTRSTCTKVTTEIKPVFYIKGFHCRATSDVESIAADLLAPMFEVTLHPQANGLDETARAVVQGIQKIQKNGPFNLAGDSIRTDLILRIARILEEKGFASVVFVMDESIKEIREELSILQDRNKLSSSILEICLSEDRRLHGWKSAPQLSWEKQVSTALTQITSINEEQRENVACALEHIKVSLQHIREATEEVVLKHGVIRSIRKGDDFKDFDLGVRQHVHKVPASTLHEKKISHILTANLATPIIQLNLEKAKFKST